MRLFITIAALVSLVLCGCSRSASDKDDIIGYVNRDPIYKSDLKRDIALRAKFDPTFKVTPETRDEQLDVIVEKKLIVQYAMEKGLAREERFVNAIRSIWEHTLIKDFLDYKKKEWQDYLFATEDDVKKYYDNMSYRETFRIFKSRDKRKADEAYKKYLKDKDTSRWEVAGPFGYDEISSVILLDAFSMNEREAKAFDDAPNYYVIEVSGKEKVELPPLDTIKPDMEKRVIAMKERRLFEDWLKDRKKKSDIKIDKEYSG